MPYAVCSVLPPWLTSMALPWPPLRARATPAMADDATTPSIARFIVFRYRNAGVVEYDRHFVSTVTVRNERVLEIRTRPGE